MAGKKMSKLKKVFWMILLISLITGGAGGFWAYRTIYSSNVDLGEKKSLIIYIPTGSNFEDVMGVLKKEHVLRKSSSFEWLAEKKHYKNAVKPGKYRVLPNMSNNALVNLLRAGIQEPVEINFNGLHTVDQLVARVGKRLEADSTSLYRAFHDNGFLSKYGFDESSIQTMLMPNTYQFYWNTSVEQFFDKMAGEYKDFWTDARKAKARQIGLSQTETCILASIVQGEQCCDDEEKRIIAGLYMNRIKQNMPLQSDPTVIFAVGDFSIQRVSYEQTRLDSPYNTYMVKGLPPGPIGFAQQSSIDAVLEMDHNDYIYMCAKEDLSGKHYFSKTYEQHQVYAKKYRDALNSRGIH